MANMKYLFLGLALLVLSEVHAQNVLDNSCLELVNIENLNQACCKQRKFWFDKKLPEFERCKNIKVDTEEDLCAYIVCVFEELGIMKDGKVQNDLIQKNDKNDTFVIELKRKCFGGKNQRLSLTNNCPAVDISACIYLNIAVTCDVWDEKEDCKKTVATAKKCKETLDRGSG